MSIHYPLSTIHYPLSSIHHYPLSSVLDRRTNWHYDRIKSVIKYDYKVLLPPGVPCVKLILRKNADIINTFEEVLLYNYIRSHSFLGRAII